MHVCVCMSVLVAGRFNAILVVLMHQPAANAVHMQPRQKHKRRAGVGVDIHLKETLSGREERERWSVGVRRCRCASEANWS